MADTMQENPGLGARLSDLGQQVKTTASSLKDAVVEKSGDAYNVVREKGGQAYQVVVDKGGQAVKVAHEKTEATIKANPYTSVLVAFGIGALLGVALSRR